MTNNPPSAQIKPGEYGFPLKLKARYDNFIGGEWVAPADGEYYQNLTPVTGSGCAKWRLRANETSIWRWMLRTK